MEKDEVIGAREARQQHHQQHIPMQVTDIINPRDVCNRFMNRSQQHKQSGEEEETEEEIELSLGLSLNGRFGVDPTRDNNSNTTTTNNKLMRSSSIPDFINPIARKVDNSSGGNESGFVVSMSASAGNHLIRTCSLPTETEEDWRKRKELQTLRRMEAKRKRSEKQRNLKIPRQRSTRVVFGEENNSGGGEGGGGGEEEEFKGAAAGIVRRGGGGTCDAVEGALPPPPPPPSPVVIVAPSQGSNGSSQASGSSGISEFESQPPQGITGFQFASYINILLTTT